MMKYELCIATAGDFTKDKEENARCPPRNTLKTGKVGRPCEKKLLKEAMRA
jgi:hypothetical protein